MMLADGFVDEYAGWIGLVGVVIGIGGPLVALIIYKLQKQPTSLDYLVSSVIPIINLDASRSGLEMTYHGRPVDDPYVARVRIQNTGKTPLRGNDFDDNLAIDFGPGSHMIWFGGVEQSHAKIKTTVFTGEKSPDDVFTFDFNLLNPGDWIEWQFTVDGEPEISVEGRGSNVNDIRDMVLVGEQVSTRRIAIIAAVTLLLIGVTLTILALTGRSSSLVFVIGGGFLSVFVRELWGSRRSLRLRKSVTAAKVDKLEK